MHDIPPDSEKDADGGNKETKDHVLRIVEIGCILGLSSLKKNHKTPPQYPGYGF